VSFSHWLIVTSLKSITSLICRIDASELKQVPRTGPLIIYTNHVNILEIPIIYTRLQPRKVHGMLLAERWNIPLLRWMLDVTETIPVHRGEADIDAIHKGLDVLARGRSIIISPEGTRSHAGKLQQAHPGVVLLALHSRASLVPVAYYGAENWHENIKHLRRTDFHLRVGKCFRLDAAGEKVTKEVRQRMMDEMMYQLSQLLPPEYRGYYAGAPGERPKYLVFE
jgi:1-acyl-sn-glycerol-3-phosphate acyltransferase